MRRKSRKLPEFRREMSGFRFIASKQFWRVSFGRELKEDIHDAAASRKTPATHLAKPGNGEIRHVRRRSPSESPQSVVALPPRCDCTSLIRGGCRDILR